MTRIPLTEAQLRLPELIASLQPGEEVQIFSGDSFAAARSADRTVARLIAELQPPRKPRLPGSAIGTLTIVSEDETHLEDEHDYMPWSFCKGTQAFLWFVLNDRALSQVACDLIVNPPNDILLSSASYWEIAIKISIGKYQIPGNFETWMKHQIQVNELEILPIKVAHAAAIVALPFHHKDPFDRLLVAQALTEKIPIISVDAVLDNYAVTRYW